MPIDIRQNLSFPSMPRLERGKWNRSEELALVGYLDKVSGLLSRQLGQRVRVGQIAPGAGGAEFRITVRSENRLSKKDLDLIAADKDVRVLLRTAGPAADNSPRTGYVVEFYDRRGEAVNQRYGVRHLPRPVDVDSFVRG